MNCICISEEVRPVNEKTVQNTQAGPLPAHVVQEILCVLETNYPQAVTALRYQNSFQLLVAVILSAQTTDRQVNRVTEQLFQRVEHPQQLLELNDESLEDLLKGCGLFRQKGRQLKQTARLLLEKYGGAVPQSREELVKLPGVGRKTANVVISTAFDTPAFAVDTHVKRVAWRLGFTDHTDFLKVETDLCRLIPRDRWTETHHRLISHGRKICRARNPLCPECDLSPYCRYVKRKGDERSKGE